MHQRGQHTHDAAKTVVKWVGDANYGALKNKKKINEKTKLKIFTKKIKVQKIIYYENILIKNAAKISKVD